MSRALLLPVGHERRAGSKAAHGTPAFPKSFLDRKLQACKPKSEPGKLVESVMKKRIGGYVLPEKEAA